MSHAQHFCRTQAESGRAVIPQLGLMVAACRPPAPRPAPQFAFSPAGDCRAVDTLYIDLGVDVFFMVPLTNITPAPALLLSLPCNSLLSVSMRTVYVCVVAGSLSVRTLRSCAYDPSLLSFAVQSSLDSPLLRSTAERSALAV
jgi:hypothetical protein